MDSKSLRFITHQSFFLAVRSGDLESLKNLIQNEADPSSLMALQNDEKETALYIAAKNNFIEIFRYLLGFCDLQTVMIRAKSDMNAFHVAASCGHLGAKVGGIKAVRFLKEIKKSVTIAFRHPRCSQAYGSAIPNTRANKF